MNKHIMYSLAEPVKQYIEKKAPHRGPLHQGPLFIWYGSVPFRNLSSGNKVSYLNVLPPSNMMTYFVYSPL